LRLVRIERVGRLRRERDVAVLVALRQDLRLLGDVRRRADFLRLGRLFGRLVVAAVVLGRDDFFFVVAAVALALALGLVLRLLVLVVVAALRLALRLGLRLLVLVVVAALRLALRLGLRLVLVVVAALRLGLRLILVVGRRAHDLGRIGADAIVGT